VLADYYIIFDILFIMFNFSGSMTVTELWRKVIYVASPEDSKFLVLE